MYSTQSYYRNPATPCFANQSAESDPCVVLADELARSPVSTVLRVVDTPDKKSHHMTKAQMNRVIALLRAKHPDSPPSLFARLEAFRA